MRFLNASIWDRGALETASSVTSRLARCTTLPSIWSATNEQLGQPSAHPGPNMIHNQLVSAAKQIRQGYFSAGRIEDIFLLHSDPRQLAALRAERVALACEILLPGQQILPGGEPFRSRYYSRMLYLSLCHDCFSLASAR